MSLRGLVLSLLIALTATGCAGRAWRTALHEDTAASYHAFLREHPGSGYAQEAKARLAFVRVRAKPTREGFEQFQKQFPTSPLVAELRPYVETAFFETARARGSVDAYREFLAEFPDGSLAERARGNLAYVEAGGFGGDIDALAAFAREHPQSDFAAEASRSVEAFGVRTRAQYRRVGLVVEFAPGVPDVDRLRRTFTERVSQEYQRAGLVLVPLAGLHDPRVAQVDATLVVSHRERKVSARVEEGAISQSGVEAETDLTLSAPGVEGPIWQETLGFRIPATEASPGESALFHPRAWSTYWQNDFFAPIATWDTRAAARTPQALAKSPVAVQASGSRALVLFSDGDFQILDVGDPQAPVPVAEYQRPRDLSHFSGILDLGGRVAIYGPDGIEIVGFGDGRARREQVLPRDQVGSIVAIERVPQGLIAAGNRGLLLIQSDGRVQRLLDREVLGLALYQGRLLFTDGNSLYLAALPVLAGGRVEGELRLGRGFRPASVRVTGAAAVVIGDPGLVWVDVSRPSQPRIVSRLDRKEVGEIRDARVVDGRIFLVGSHGLLISDRSGEHVADSVDVAARHRLDVAGRHILLVGEHALQVVDATPFTATMPAARAR